MKFLQRLFRSQPYNYVNQKVKEDELKGPLSLLAHINIGLKQSLTKGGYL